MPRAALTGVRLVCALALSSIVAAGQGVISGAVLDALNNEPIRKAVVTVTWHGTPRSWATTRTDGSGRFRFEGLPAGTYDLRATKAGIGTAIYGAKSVRELGDTITLGDRESREGLKLRFVHSAELSGRVLDSDGDPIVYANIRVLRPGRNLGERVLLNYRNANTNDRGEYRIGNIDPGQYYLVADPNSPDRRGIIGQAGGHERFRAVSQFLGGALESKDAKPLTIHGGENLTGLDFHITMEPAAHLSGHVTGVPELSPLPKPRAGQVWMHGDQRFVNIQFSPVEEGGQQWGMGVGAAPPDYKFEMGDLAPGRYRLEATVQEDKKTYSASQIVDTRQNSGEITLALAPAVDVKGRFKMEGQVGKQNGGFQIRLSRANGRSGIILAHVSPDGSFTLLQVPPGEWEWTIDAFPRGGFLKSAHLGDQDVTFGRLEIAAGSDAQFNILASMNAAKIDGEIDAGAGDSKRAGIMIAPLGNRHTLARFYYAVNADDAGKFKMIGIAPGKYKIFALEKMAGAEFRNPEAADQLGELGEEIELTEGGSLTLHPKLIPMERAREALP